jgi:hypothetical protein
MFIARYSGDSSSWGTPVGRVTGLTAGKPRNRSSIPGRGR